MTDTIFNKPDYFYGAPKHIRKKYDSMLRKAFKKEIRNGLDIKIKKFPMR